MLATLNTVQAFAMLALGVGAFAASAYCLVDALRHPKESFAHAEKLSKTWWTVILVIAVLVTLVSISNVLAGGLFSILAIVAVGVYLADVRPALRQVTPRIRRRRNSAGGHGPHGSW